MNVGAGGAFRHHSFQSKFFDVTKELFAFSFDMIRIFDEAGRPQNIFQQSFPFDDWAGSQVIAITVEQVECKIDDLRFSARRVTATSQAKLVL